MTVAITGTTGRLGATLLTSFAQRGTATATWDRQVWDLDDESADLDALIQREEVDLIVHAAAWTSVDGCELDPPRAHHRNGKAVGRLAEAARRHGARLIYLSTDYVFAGKSVGTYAAHELVDPVNAYGSSKALGEMFALTTHPHGTQVVRTAWLYGRPGHSFVEALPAQLRAGVEMPVITDAIGQPTFVADLAERIVELVEQPIVPGIFHATNSGEATWLEVARRIAAHVGADENLLVGITAGELQRPARRPTRTILDHSMWANLGLKPMRPWQEALDDFLAGERQ